MISIIASSEKIWADQGGLIGLVLFALFALITAFLVAISKKDKDNQSFLSKILDDNREERRESQRITSENTKELSDALRHLTEEIRATRTERRSYTKKNPPNN